MWLAKFPANVRPASTSYSLAMPAMALLKLRYQARGAKAYICVNLIYLLTYLGVTVIVVRHKEMSKNVSKRGGDILMQYVFTAIITKDADGMFHAGFPDLPGCLAQGKDMVTVVQNAESVLRLVLFDMEQTGVRIPKPRYPDDLFLQDGEVASVVFTNTDPYHERFANKVTDHTLSVPAWVGQIADASGLDLERILQDAVKQEIGMPVHKSPKGNAISVKPVRAPGEVALPERAVAAQPQKQNTELALRPRGLAPTGPPRGEQTLQKPDKPMSSLPINDKTGSLFTYLVIGLSFLLVVAIAGTIVITQTDIIYRLLLAEDQEAIDAEYAQMQALMQAIMAAQQEAYEQGLLYTDGGDEAQPDYPTSGGAEYEAEPLAMDSLRAWYENDDIVGRISIDGTSIDVPVVQAFDNSFYRHHDIRRVPNENGWVFLDSVMNLGEHNNHLVLHGSSLQYGALFNYLPNFVDQSLFDRSPMVRFTTDHDEYWFEIFSFYIDDGNFAFADVNNESGWGDWIDLFAIRTMHPTSMQVSGADRVLTLIAHRYAGSQERYILHARLIG